MTYAQTKSRLNKQSSTHVDYLERLVQKKEAKKEEQDIVISPLFYWSIKEKKLLSTGFCSTKMLSSTKHFKLTIDNAALVTRAVAMQTNDAIQLEDYLFGTARAQVWISKDLLADTVAKYVSTTSSFHVECCISSCNVFSKTITVALF